MSTIYSAFTTIVNNWPAYAVALFPLGFAIGIAGHIFTLIGALLVGSSWAPVRALGHTFELVGGLLNSVYAHWGQFFGAISKFVADIKALLPKGPTGGAGAAALAFMIVLTCSCTTGCSATVGKDVQSVLEVVLDAALYGPDAGNWIDQIVEAAVAHFESSPDPVAQAAFDADLADARAALTVAIQNGAADKNMTPAELLQNYGAFVTAALKLADDAEKLGLFAQPGELSSPAAARALGGPVKPIAPPLPLVVQRAKGQS